MKEEDIGRTSVPLGSGRLELVSTTLIIHYGKEVVQLDSYSPARKNALIDWMFQLGFGSARQFRTSIRLIKEQKWKEAAANMMKSNWAKQTPNRAKEITKMIEEG